MCIQDLDDYMRFDRKDIQRYIKGEQIYKNETYITCRDYSENGFEFWLEIDEKLPLSLVYELKYKTDDRCMELFDIFFSEKYKEYSLMELVAMWLDLFNIPFEKVLKAHYICRVEPFGLIYEKKFTTLQGIEFEEDNSVILATLGRNNILTISNKVYYEPIKNLVSDIVMRKYVCNMFEIVPINDNDIFYIDDFMYRNFSGMLNDVTKEFVKYNTVYLGTSYKHIPTNEALINFVKKCCGIVPKKVDCYLNPHISFTI